MATPTKPTTAPAKKKAPMPKLSTRDGKGGDGVACVNNIVANDRQTHAFLVQAIFYREMARRAGRTNAAASAALDKTLASFLERQRLLRTSKLLKTNTDTTQWANTWWNKLKAMVSGPGVGVLPALPAAVVGVIVGVVILGTAAACWAIFSPHEPKSAADVKTSFESSEVYRGMTPEQQQASSDAVDEAGKGGYQDGKDAADNSLFGQVKQIALVLGCGYVGLKLFENSRKGG